MSELLPFLPDLFPWGRPGPPGLWPFTVAFSCFALLALVHQRNPLPRGKSGFGYRKKATRKNIRQLLIGQIVFLAACYSFLILSILYEVTILFLLFLNISLLYFYYIYFIPYIYLFSSQLACEPSENMRSCISHLCVLSTWSTVVSGPALPCGLALCTHWTFLS